MEYKDTYDSFYKLEETFQAVITIDFYHMDNNNMEEYEKLGIVVEVLTLSICDNKKVDEVFS